MIAQAPPEAPALAPLSVSAQLSALAALFRLTLRQHVRARRLLVLGALFLLPAAVALAARYVNPDLGAEHLEVALVLTLIPHALVPLAALLYASGMIQDELEDQTLTYLLIRPLPRWTMYTTKLAATILATSLLADFFCLVTYAAIFVGPGGEVSGAIALRALKSAGLLALALVAYCSLFGFLSLLTRRSFVVGVAYVILLEVLVANIPFLARRLTVIYYFRVLAERWLPIRVNAWAIDLPSAPSARESILCVAGASLVMTAAAAFWFTVREFRVKTPEGS
jgi:ABC-2 type transport system permease protein